MNTSKYNWILYFISATIVITIAVQVYWNYKNFQLNKQRVTNEIQLSLDNALEEYYAGLAKTDFLTIIKTDNQNHDGSRFSFGKAEININTNSHKNDPAKVDSLLTKVQNKMTQSLILEQRRIKYDSISGFTQFNDSGEGFTVMRPNSIESVKVLKGRKAYDSLGLLKNIKPILIALERDSLEYNKIDSLLKQQLSAKNIDISYWLDHKKNDTLFYTSWSNTKDDELIKDDTLYMITEPTAKSGNYFFVNSKSTYLKPKEQFKLGYKNPFREALKRSSFGIILSFLLATAIVSCLFYLLKIIKHQKQLAEVKNDLISNITHEFKTPIATIGVALESIKNFKVIDDKKKTENYLDMSSEQLSKLNIMVEKLLETATLDSENLNLNKEETNINDLLNTVSSKHQLQNEEKRISFIDAEYPVLANVDIFHFENAINNLIDNAIKYGGDTIKVKLNRNKDDTIISVTDNGNTLTKINKERIFEKFYRIPKGNTHDVKGFGIGLYYTKKIIEKHGGNIQLDLNNKLTAFNITIPMSEFTTILLAEDEPALGQIIKESLETRNFNVLLCENGQIAYETYLKEKPQLLVLDVMMPKKDGFTLAKEIRMEDDNIPIIFLTAKSQTQDVVEGFTIGGNDYLKKPFSIEELIVRINNLLDRTKLQKNSEVLEISKYVFDFPKQTLKFNDEESIQLTHREAHLLFHLIKNKNEVLDRSLILNKLWGTDDFFAARSMDVFITKLRKKLKQDDSIQIVNVRGFGYKLIC